RSRLRVGGGSRLESVGGVSRPAGALDLSEPPGRRGSARVDREEGFRFPGISAPAPPRLAAPDPPRDPDAARGKTVRPSPLSGALEHEGAQRAGGCREPRPSGERPGAQGLRDDPALGRPHFAARFTNSPVVVSTTTHSPRSR